MDNRYVCRNCGTIHDNPQKINTYKGDYIVYCCNGDKPVFLTESDSLENILRVKKGQDPRYIEEETQKMIRGEGYVGDLIRRRYKQIHNI